MLSHHVAEALRRSQYRIIITGASGWLGRATLELLHAALGPEFESRVVCYGSQPRELRLRADTAVVQRPLSQLDQLPPAPSLLLHLAFLTKDRAEEMDEKAYRAANRQISATVLGALDRIGVDAVFVASSGAAAFADDPDATPAMRLYGSMKRDDEDAFAGWAKRSGKRAVITRIHNLSGPHINKVQSYALASFIMDASAGRPIIVRAPHDVVRGYVAIRELMSLVMAMLLDSRATVTRFDSGGDAIELGDLAREVSLQLGGVPVERPGRTSGEDRYLGDAPNYDRLLDHYGIAKVSLSAQIAETAAWLRSSI